jgi:hypothetical protein
MLFDKTESRRKFGAKGSLPSGPTYGNSYIVSHGGLLPWLNVWSRNLHLTISRPPPQIVQKFYSLSYWFLWFHVGNLQENEGL